MEEQTIVVVGTLIFCCLAYYSYTKAREDWPMWAVVLEAAVTGIVGVTVILVTAEVLKAGLLKIGLL